MNDQAAGSGRGTSSQDQVGQDDVSGPVDGRSRPLSVTLAAVIAAVEGVALAVWAGYMVVEGFVGHPGSRVGAEVGGLTVFTLAALPLLAARGLLRVRRWGRGPVLIIQLLALPMAWSMVQNGGAMIAAGVALGGLALAGLATLLHPTATDALR